MKQLSQNAGGTTTVGKKKKKTTTKNADTVTRESQSGKDSMRKYGENMFELS